jgi:2-oxoglutarate ferredoxin oxidoreductase subunit alpha
MVELRQNKVDVIANDIPKTTPFGNPQGDLLVLGWGGTYGAIRSAVESARNENYAVSHLHLRYLNPLPNNLGDILVKFQKVLIPELNMGQLSMIIRSKFLVDTISLNKVQGKPFNKNEILSEIIKILKVNN